MSNAYFHITSRYPILNFLCFLPQIPPPSRLLCPAAPFARRALPPRWAEIARLHALSLKLWTPEEWAKRSAEVPAALLATDRGSAATTAAAAEPAAVIEAAPAAAAEEAAKADA